MSEPEFHNPYLEEAAKEAALPDAFVKSFNRKLLQRGLEWCRNNVEPLIALGGLAVGGILIAKDPTLVTDVLQTITGTTTPPPLSEIFAPLLDVDNSSTYPLTPDFPVLPDQPAPLIPVEPAPIP